MRTLRRKSSYSTKNLTSSFGWSGEEVFAQHDASEALVVVIAALQQELSEGGAGGSIARERGLRHATLGEHIGRVHTGTMVHSTTCRGCGTVRSRTEPFTTLLLPVRGHGDLHSALRALVCEEELKGDNAYACDTCKGKREAARCVRLQGGEGLPESLVLHLNRHEYNCATGRRQKVDDAMRFFQELDLAPYLVPAEGCAQQQAPSADPASSGCDAATSRSGSGGGAGSGGGGGGGAAMYDLSGVLLHTGGAGGGHYFSYLKARAADMAIPAADGGSGGAGEFSGWLCFNDSSISTISSEDLPRALGTAELSAGASAAAAAAAAAAGGAASGGGGGGSAPPAPPPPSPPCTLPPPQPTC